MPSWSISAEMGLYLILPGFLILARRVPSLLIVISAATLGMMYYLSGGPDGNELDGWTNWTVAFGAVRGLAGFSLGMALYAYRKIVSKIPFAFPLLLISVAAFLGFGLAGLSPMWVAPLAYAIAIFGILTDLSGGPGKTVRKLSGLGQLTYSIYMLHMPVYFLAVSVVGEHLLNLQGAAYGGWMVFSTVLVLPAAWVSLILFERPARIWASQLGRTPRHAAARAPAAAMMVSDAEPLSALSETLSGEGAV